MTKIRGEEYLAARKQSRRISAEHHGEAPEVVSNIPIPQERRGGFRIGNTRHFYPFETMQVGDSFWVPNGEGKECTRGAVSKFSARTGWEFKVRGQSRAGKDNKEVNNKALRGTRVWRIS